MDNLNSELNYTICYTLIDITETGITGTFRKDFAPYKTKQGKDLKTFEAWTTARNKRRNWETLMQIINLRAQVLEIINPRARTVSLEKYKFGDQYTGKQKVWSFIFANEKVNVFDQQDGDYGALMEDSDHVPVIVDLGESVKMPPLTQVNGPNTNIYFEKYEYKNNSK